MDVPSLKSSTPPGQRPLERPTAIPSSAATNTNQTGITPVQEASGEKKKVDATELNKAVGEINKALQDHGQDLRFSIDSDSKRVVVRIIDQNTSQVLRQIPSEQALEISKSLDKLQGLLIKQNA